MDGHVEDGGSERMRLEPAAFRERGESAVQPVGRPGPTWRAWVMSILAAILLSVAATLILGGSFRSTAASNAAAGGCGAAGPCCPPRGDGGR